GCLKEVTNDFCRTVREIPSRRVTRRELMRDLNASKSGIRLLERMGWLVPISVSGQKRPTYDLQEALLTVVLFQGLAAAPRVRIKRKDSNVTTVARETVNRVVRKEIRIQKPRCEAAVTHGINGDGHG